MNIQRAIDKFYENYRDEKNFLLYQAALAEVYKKAKKESALLYSDFTIAYQSIIESTAKLCFELNLKDSMSAFTAFDYLLWNGYFSKDKSYAYEINKRLNINGYYSLDIINGHGVCLNKVHLLDGILKAMNYESYLITNLVKEPFKQNYMPKIDRKVNAQKNSSSKILQFLTLPIQQVFGNHACTLVRKNSVYYVYDPTNLCVYKLNKFLQADMIGGELVLLI